jgi:hypothetical protein
MALLTVKKTLPIRKKTLNTTTVQYILRTVVYSATRMNITTTTVIRVRVEAVHIHCES